MANAEVIRKNFILNCTCTCSPKILTSQPVCRCRIDMWRQYYSSLILHVITLELTFPSSIFMLTGIEQVQLQPSPTLTVCHSFLSFHEFHANASLFSCKDYFPTSLLITSSWSFDQAAKGPSFLQAFSAFWHLLSCNVSGCLIDIAQSSIWRALFLPDQVVLVMRTYALFQNKALLVFLSSLCFVRVVQLSRG